MLGTIILKLSSFGAEQIFIFSNSTFVFAGGGLKDHI